jgi:hypothetical protein
MVGYGLHKIMNYVLNAPIEGCTDIKLYSKSGLELCNGYSRIVIGGRGPYVEFTDNQVIFKAFHIPKDQLFRLTDRRVYYIEMRSVDDAFVKLYYQLQTVAYADYKIGLLYISPYDLYLSNGECMATSKIVVSKDNEFFS